MRTTIAFATVVAVLAACLVQSNNASFLKGLRDRAAARGLTRSASAPAAPATPATPTDAKKCPIKEAAEKEAAAAAAKKCPKKEAAEKAAAAAQKAAPTDDKKCPLKEAAKRAEAAKAAHNAALDAEKEKSQVKAAAEKAAPAAAKGSISERLVKPAEPKKQCPLKEAAERAAETGRRAAQAEIDEILSALKASGEVHEDVTIDFKETITISESSSTSAPISVQEQGTVFGRLRNRARSAVASAVNAVKAPTAATPAEPKRKWALQEVAEKAAEVGKRVAKAEIDDILLALNAGGKVDADFSINIDETITISEPSSASATISVHEEGSVLGRLRNLVGEAIPSAVNNIDKAVATAAAAAPALHETLRAGATGLRERLQTTLSSDNIDKAVETAAAAAPALHETLRAGATGLRERLRTRWSAPPSNNSDKAVETAAAAAPALHETLRAGATGLRERLQTTLSSDNIDKAVETAAAAAPALHENLRAGASGILGRLQTRLSLSPSDNIDIKKNTSTKVSEEVAAEKQPAAKNARLLGLPNPSSSNSLNATLLGLPNPSNSSSSSSSLNATLLGLPNPSSSSSLNATLLGLPNLSSGSLHADITFSADLPIHAKVVLEAASSLEYTDEELLELVSSLVDGRNDGADLLAVARGANAEVSLLLDEAHNALKEAVSSGRKTVVEIVENATRSWGAEVREAVALASRRGVDVRGCAASSVSDLAKQTASAAVSTCAASHIVEAVKLSKVMVEVVADVAALREEALEAQLKCSLQVASVAEHSSLHVSLTASCHEERLRPVVYKSVLLVDEAVKLGREALAIVEAFDDEVGRCAEAVATKESAKASALGAKVVSCVANKIYAA